MTKPFVSILKSMCQAVGLALVAIAGAHATPALTAASATAGFGLSQFANNFPNNGAVGPLGIAFNGAKVVVSDYSGNVRIFATDTDGQNAASAPLAQNYGGGAAGLTRSGNFFYLAQQNSGQVLRLNLDGTFNSVVAVGITTATGMFTNPVTGKVYISDCCNNTGIWELNPATNAMTNFKFSGNYDGLSVSADGSVLYAEIGQHIIGYRLSDGFQVFDSGFISAADGTELGSGTLAGKIFVNTNFGELYEVDLVNPSAIGGSVVIVDGGTRGDFVTADPNNGSLLFVQTSDIWRLSAPQGGCIGAACGAGGVPEPSSLMLAGVALLGLGASTTRRRLPPTA